MKARYTKSFIAVSMLATLMAGCGHDDTNPPASANTRSLQLNLSNLEDLGANAVYEGWVITNGAPVSTGRFTVNSSGVLSQTQFTIPQAVAAAATTFVLTIEPALNDVPAPTDLHLVAGNFSANVANVNLNHPAAFGQNFSTATGEFMLTTPTSAATTDEDLGIWFLKMVNGSPVAGLTLPALPTGWVYEGWVVVNGTPYTTGRFTDVMAADSDGAGMRAGPLGSPPFPGQDFITPPLSLVGGMAVISVEPEDDNSPAPFLLKPLAGPIGAPLAPNVQMIPNTVGVGATLPSGTVTIN